MTPYEMILDRVAQTSNKVTEICDKAGKLLQDISDEIDRSWQIPPGRRRFNKGGIAYKKLQDALQTKCRPGSSLIVSLDIVIGLDEHFLRQVIISIAYESRANAIYFGGVSWRVEPGYSPALVLQSISNELMRFFSTELFGKSFFATLGPNGSLVHL